MGGWAFTSAVWQANRDILEKDLAPRETFNNTLYYTAMTSHPWVPEHKRINEVWFPEAESLDISWSWPAHTNRKVCHTRNINEFIRDFIFVSRLARNLIMMLQEVLLLYMRYWRVLPM